MFNKAKKHASRVGLRPVKALFSIQIVSVTLPRSTPIVDQAILSACFERGGKISATKNVTYEKPAFVREVVVEFDEKVELMATLYKDFKTGRYQEKQALLILREQTKHRFGHDSYKGWGKYNLNLHELLNELGFDRTRTKEMIVKLELLIGVTMKIIVTSTIVSTGKDDETMSVSSYMSDASEMSTLAASFSHVPSVGASMGTSRLNSANSTIHTSSIDNTVEKDNDDVDDEAEDPDSRKEQSQAPQRDAAQAASSASPRTFASYFSNPFTSTTNAFDYKSDKYSIPESPATGHEVEVSQHEVDEISKGLSDSDEEHSDHDANSSDRESDSEKQIDHHSKVMDINSKGKGPALSAAVISPAKGPASSESWFSTHSKPSSSYRSPQPAAHTTDTSSTSPTVQAPHPATTRQRFQDLLHRHAHKDNNVAGHSSGGGIGAGGADSSVVGGAQSSSEASEDHSPRRFGWSRKHHDSDGHSESGDAAEDSNPSANDVHHADSNGTAEHHIEHHKDQGYKKGLFSRVMKPLTHHNHAHAHAQNHNNHRSAHHDIPDPVDVAHLNSPASELPQPDSSRSHSTEASKEAFSLYDTELQRRGTHIARLEQALADQSAHSAIQIAALKAELANTVAALRKEKVARAVIAEVTHKGDDVLAAALSEARDEASRAVAERAAVLVELQDLRKEAALHREQVAQLRQQQAQEMELSQQAAAVAASASVRRAEAEDEAQQLLDQLIAVKMEHANMSMELEETRRSNFQLHRRLQSYAQQVASLEVKYAHALHQRENDQDED